MPGPAVEDSLCATRRPRGKLHSAERDGCVARAASAHQPTEQPISSKHGERQHKPYRVRNELLASRAKDSDETLAATPGERSRNGDQNIHTWRTHFAACVPFSGLTGSIARGGTMSERTTLPSLSNTPTADNTNVWSLQSTV